MRMPLGRAAISDGIVTGTDMFLVNRHGTPFFIYMRSAPFYAPPGDFAVKPWQLQTVVKATTDNVSMNQPTKYDLNPDRLLPPDPTERAIARDLYDSVKDLPIISPHGHVPVEWFHDKDYHFSDPTSLFITPDHYVTRVMHSQGVALKDLGVNQKNFTPEQARNAFLIWGKNWGAYAGTPMRYWFEDSLQNVFDIHTKFGEDTAGRIYDELNDLLKQPEFSTRELVKKFNIGFISTTDDTLDDLHLHDETNADPDFPARLAPAFRPDVYLEPSTPGWAELVGKLGDVAGVDTSTYEGFTAAIKSRRLYFKQHGAVLSDHSHADVRTDRLSDSEVTKLYAQALAGTISTEDATRLRRHFFSDQVRMAQEDGLVMTVHPHVHRSYDPSTLAEYGKDTGGDIPAKAEFAVDLKPLLNEYGNNPDFHFVVFTMDETVYARELAPLAGFYPSLYIGAPWWFIDAPEPILRYYEEVTPNAGFTKLSGFIDDTRALCSIPARHDTNRRLTARYVAGLVADHRLSLEEGRQIVIDSVVAQPKKVFNLD